MPDTKTLYDEDIVAWSRQQAEALRAAARGGSNQPIDWENIAEEIGDLAVSQRSAVGSYVMRIIQHLVNWTIPPPLSRAMVGGVQSASSACKFRGGFRPARV